MSERLYSTTRVGPGDYLVPSNRGDELFRVCRYYEEGSASSTDRRGRERKTIGWFWRTLRYTGTFPFPNDRVPDDLLEWYDDSWRETSCLWRTKRQALDYLFPVLELADRL